MSRWNPIVGCSVEGCDRPHVARGWCGTHYERWRQHGTPDPERPIFEWRGIETHFWERVEKTDGCWLWRHRRDPNGYGRCKVLNKEVLAHRFAYEALVGPIPEGLVLDHLCCNPPCVNPDHLDPVPQYINVRRYVGVSDTHCKRGHPRNEENTYLIPGTQRRYCRICQRDWMRRKRAMKNQRAAGIG